MNKSNDNVRSSERDDLVVLGVASVETKGPPEGSNEPFGRILVPGIAED